MHIQIGSLAYLQIVDAECQKLNLVKLLTFGNGYNLSKKKFTASMSALRQPFLRIVSVVSEIGLVSSHILYPAPPMSSPPPGYTVPPHPGGNRHQVTVPPLGGGEPYTTPDQPILV